jgi:uncharacterized protein with NAD-binding domain and iron-sulfur cluster
MRQKVVIIGGGVAGMSAAQELGERGFQVEVYERNPVYVGGKARSVNVPGTNLQHPDKFLPGEHGFRFFPGFYKHVIDTMKRIPYRDANGRKQRKGVFGNLTHTTRIAIARYGKPTIVTIANFPKRLKDVELIIHDMVGVNTGLTREEEKFFAQKVWQLATSCKARRMQDYERIGWWEYLEADRFSKTYQTLLVEGLTRTLVAAQARTASTKTGGDIFLQLVFNMTSPGVNTDRVLNGPTNDRWLNPWLTYLDSLGVKYHKGHEATRLNMAKGKVTSITIKRRSGDSFDVTADYFLLALPVEQAAKLIDSEVLKADATLSSIPVLAQSVSWMNGMQYYLNTDVTIVNGHCIYSDSEWAVTSISQIQFWKDYDLSSRYNGKVKGILSVDVSDWKTTRFEGKLAEDCEPETAAQLVWEQIERSLNVDGKVVLDRSMIEFTYVDRDIKWKMHEGHDVDQEPLLVNTINSWSLRPEASTLIPNLMLAADYVRTNTDLATMEGANEAARRAVNCIIDTSGSGQPYCRIWDLHEPRLFKPMKNYDRRRFRKGLPYSIHVPVWVKVQMAVWGGITLAYYFLRALFSYR